MIKPIVFLDKQQECDLPIYGSNSGANEGTQITSAVTPSSVASTTPVSPTSSSSTTTTPAAISAEENKFFAKTLDESLKPECKAPFEKESYFYLIFPQLLPNMFPFSLPQATLHPCPSSRGLNPALLS